MAKRIRETAERRLACYWNAPHSLPGGPVGGGCGQPRACVATTYTFHASLFETDLLPRFLGLRFDSNERERAFVVERERALGTASVAVLVDQSHVDGSQTTLRWDQLPVDVPAGAQHAKLTMLLWERCLRMIVASGNMTRQGYRRNREIAGAIDFYDSEDSAPRSLAEDALAFVGEVAASGWIRAGTGALERLRGIVEDMRRSLKAWDRMPSDFTSRELPRVAFVGGLPARPGRRLRSPLAQLVEAWGFRRADGVTVMTPFVGESEVGQRQVIDKLLEIPRSAGVTNRLIVPGVPSEKDPATMVVGLPRWFRDTWAVAWQQAPKDLTIAVVPPCREQAGEKAQRDLHAKGIVVSDGERALLFCGSSNFSPHGMGVGSANVEANLCYLATDDSRIRAGLPVEDGDWSEVPPKWLEQPRLSEDDPPGVRLPRVFAWASCDQRKGLITLGFDPAWPLPPEWSVALAGETGAQVNVADNLTVPSIPDTREWEREMTGISAGVTVTSLKVRWRAAAGEEFNTARLAVQTVNSEAILPPEEFRTLTADAIIACLLSGRDPSELVPPPDGNGLPKKRRSGPNTDPLTFVDTCRYPMYRSRRLGRALATLGERLIRTIHTQPAMSNRLFEDPLGPSSLAAAIFNEPECREISKGFASDSFERSYRLFALSEIGLTVAHAGRKVHSERGRYEPDLRHLFVEAAMRISNLAGPDSPTADTVASGVGAYGKRVREQCRKLLGEGGGVNAG